MVAIAWGLFPLACVLRMAAAGPTPLATPVERDFDGLRTGTSPHPTQPPGILMSELLMLRRHESTAAALLKRNVETNHCGYYRSLIVCESRLPNVWRQFLRQESRAPPDY
jgi:hypothetical protein